MMIDFVKFWFFCLCLFFFFFSSRRRHTRWNCDWSSDVCSSDLLGSSPSRGTSFSAPSARPGREAWGRLGRYELLERLGEGGASGWPKDRPFSSDRKSTRLNSSHSSISYAVFCLKKKKKLIT